jgi:hypothetical protein
MSNFLMRRLFGGRAVPFAVAIRYVALGVLVAEDVNLWVLAIMRPSQRRLLIITALVMLAAAVVTLLDIIVPL